MGRPIVPLFPEKMRKSAKISDIGLEIGGDLIDIAVVLRNQVHLRRINEIPESDPTIAFNRLTDFLNRIERFFIFGLHLLLDPDTRRKILTFPRASQTDQPIDQNPAFFLRDEERRGHGVYQNLNLGG